jgi:hypothetical protein
VYLSDKPYAFGEDHDYQRRIDYAANHTPSGVELLNVSKGVDLSDLPRAVELAAVLRASDIKTFA